MYTKKEKERASKIYNHKVEAIRCQGKGLDGFDRKHQNTGGEENSAGLVKV